MEGVIRLPALRARDGSSRLGHGMTEFESLRCQGKLLFYFSLLLEGYLGTCAFIVSPFLLERASALAFLGWAYTHIFAVGFYCSSVSLLFLFFSRDSPQRFWIYEKIPLGRMETTIRMRKFLHIQFYFPCLNMCVSTADVQCYRHHLRSSSVVLSG